MRFQRQMPQSCAIRKTNYLRDSNEKCHKPVPCSFLQQVEAESPKKMRRRLSVSDVRDLAKAWAVARKMAPASQIYDLKVWGQHFCITANITGFSQNIKGNVCLTKIFEKRLWQKSKEQLYVACSLCQGGYINTGAASTFDKPVCLTL